MKMDQKQLDLLNMVYKQDFSGLKMEERVATDALLVDLEEKHLIEVKRVKSGCGGCTGCGVSLFPEIIQAGIDLLKQEGLIK